MAAAGERCLGRMTMAERPLAFRRPRRYRERDTSRVYGEV